MYISVVHTRSEAFAGGQLGGDSPLHLGLVYILCSCILTGDSVQQGGLVHGSNAAEGMVSIVGDVFVHVTTPAGAANIFAKGLDPSISGFVTKWKYIKNVLNPSESNAMLYRQNKWAETVGRFDFYFV